MTSYTQAANDGSGQVCPHLDLNWPTTGVDAARTALGSTGTMAQLQTAMANQYEFIPPSAGGDRMAAAPAV